MARETLTARGVARLRPPTKGRAEHWDAALPGFGLRITENGQRSWVLMIRRHGKLLRLTLGRLPAVGLAEARAAARVAIQKAARGEDPRIQKQEAPPPPPDTFAAVVRDFMKADRRAGTRWAAERERIVTRELLPAWGARPIAGITRRDVVALLETIADRAPVLANRVLAILGRVFRWAVNADRAPGSPCVGLERPGGRERPRERVLTDAELVKLWKAADARGPIFSAFTKLLILTGQRRGEVAGMRWEDLDLAAGLWTIPTTKAGRAHEVPLAPSALAVLATVPCLEESAWVFTTNKRTPISGFGKLTSTLTTEAKLAPWRLHDLRRSAATGMARLGIPKETIRRVLGHAEAGVTSVYVRHGWLDEKRAALTVWAAHVEAITTAK